MRKYNFLFSLISCCTAALVLAGCAGPGGVVIPGPEGLHATSITTNSFILNWSAVSGSDHYKVYRNGGTYATHVLSLSYPISGLTSGHTYRMTVSYVTGSTESSQSASYYVTTL